MQIVFHLGVHATDDGALIRSLLKNREVLGKAGVAVPGPGRYKSLLRDSINSLRGQFASFEAQEALIETVIDDDTTERIVFSNESFISMPAKAVDEDQFYPKAQKAAWLRNIFPAHDVEFALSIVNPASFLPAIMRMQEDTGAPAAEIMADIDVYGLRWSEFIQRLRTSVPDARIIVWANEDTPFIWNEVMREVTGVDTFTKLMGGLDILARIMDREGMQRLRNFMAKRPPANETARRRILAAFLEKYALDSAVMEEAALPGWTEETIERLSEIYDEDIEVIRRMPGVEFIEA